MKEEVREQLTCSDDIDHRSEPFNNSPVVTTSTTVVNHLINMDIHPQAQLFH